MKAGHLENTLVRGHQAGSRNAHGARRKARTWYVALLILLLLIVFGVTTTLVLVKLFPSTIELALEKGGITATIVGGVGLFVLLFNTYLHAYKKIVTTIVSVLSIGVVFFVFTRYLDEDLPSLELMRQKSLLYELERPRAYSSGSPTEQPFATISEVSGIWFDGAGARYEFLQQDGTTFVFIGTDPKGIRYEGTGKLRGRTLVLTGTRSLPSMITGELTLLPDGTTATGIMRERSRGTHQLELHRDMSSKKDS